LGAVGAPELPEGSEHFSDYGSFGLSGSLSRASWGGGGPFGSDLGKRRRGGQTARGLRGKQWRVVASGGGASRCVSGDYINLL